MLEEEGSIAGSEKVDGAMKNAKEANWVLLCLLGALLLPSLALHYMKVPNSPFIMMIKLSSYSLFGVVGLWGLKGLRVPFAEVFNYKKIPLSLILTAGTLITLHITLALCEMLLTNQARDFFQLPQLRQPLEEILPLLRSPKLFVAFFLYATVLGPLCEELFFRGYFQRAYARMGTLYAVLVPSLLFAFLHGGSMAPLSKAFMGATLALVSLRHGGSIVPSFLIHVLNNLLPTATIVFVYTKVLPSLSQRGIPTNPQLPPMQASTLLSVALFYLFLALLSGLFLRRLYRQCPADPDPQLPLRQGWKILLHPPLILLAYTISSLAY